MPALSEAEAVRRFREARVAHLATVARDGRPHLVPVTFALLGADRIISAVDHKPKRTTALARLTHIETEPRVALLVDAYTEDWSALWWVRADGRAEVVDPPVSSAERAELLAPLVSRYAPYDERPPSGPIVVVTVERWSGWAAS